MRNATFVGRVARSPEMLQGKSCAPVTIAINESFKNKETNEYEQRSYFVTTWAYGRTAEYAERNLQKGDVVSIEARVGTLTNDKGHTDGYNFSVNNLSVVSRSERKDTGDMPF